MSISLFLWKWLPLLWHDVRRYSKRNFFFFFWIQLKSSGVERSEDDFGQVEVCKKSGGGLIIQTSHAFFAIWFESAAGTIMFADVLTVVGFSGSKVLISP